MVLCIVVISNHLYKLIIQKIKENFNNGVTTCNFQPSDR